MSARPSLLFVSSMFLQPVDTGARIRTTQILRGLREGAFDVVLGSPATGGQLEQYRLPMEALATRYFSWPAAERNAWFHLARMRYLPGVLPIPVATDYSARGARLIAAELAAGHAVTVFDFPHSMVLAPAEISCPTVLFTHNVEAEIFARHAQAAADPLRRYIWRDQQRKMAAFERRVMGRVDLVIAVSERDAEYMRDHYGVRQTVVIPTGTDVDFFDYQAPGAGLTVVFCGSMDWLANIEGIEWFMNEVWPLVTAAVPEARMKVVGRAPPAALVRRAKNLGIAWEFTGWVEDVRPHVHGCAAFVIPLRVAGGTRLKVFEAMAMGAPVVSTGIGVEGLPLEAGKHYLAGDTAEELARAVVLALREPELRSRLARAARKYVEDEASFRRAAAVFEAACLSVARNR